MTCRTPSTGTSRLTTSAANTTSPVEQWPSNCDDTGLSRPPRGGIFSSYALRVTAVPDGEVVCVSMAPSECSTSHDDHGNQEAHLVPHPNRPPNTSSSSPHRSCAVGGPLRFNPREPPLLRPSPGRRVSAPGRRTATRCRRRPRRTKLKRHERRRGVRVPAVTESVEGDGRHRWVLGQLVPPRRTCGTSELLARRTVSPPAPRCP